MDQTEAENRARDSVTEWLVDMVAELTVRLESCPEVPRLEPEELNRRKRQLLTLWTAEQHPGVAGKKVIGRLLGEP